jgi:type I restriction-modification system DNA methylase subunit
MSKTKAPENFRKILENISRRHDTRRVFDAFTRLAACALACETREPEYMEEIKQWEKPELESFSKALGALVIEMETRPFEDLLGSYYMEFALSTKGQQWNGEFHTPPGICKLMAGLTLQDASLPSEGPITVSEPACGAGAMILALGESVSQDVRRRLRVTAVDVNRTACDMCFINTTLWGIPTRVVHGNTLSLETWGDWPNIHWMMPWLPLAIGFEEKKEPDIQIAKPAEIKRESFVESGLALGLSKEQIEEMLSEIAA